MQSNLLVCDNMEYLSIENLYKLGKVLNRIEIATIPHISPFFVLIKIFYMDPKKQYEMNMVIYDEEDEVYFSSAHKVVYNQREKTQIPGVDLSIRIATPFCKEGVYTCKLFIDDVLSAQYPLSIVIKKEDI
ncbi:DUF6941 family protein [Cytobacillus sp. Hm23]